MSYAYRCEFCGSTNVPLFTSSIGTFICSMCLHDRQMDRYDSTRDQSDNITFGAKKDSNK